MEDKRKSIKRHDDQALAEKILALDQLWKKLAAINFKWDVGVLRRSAALAEELEKITRYFKDEVMIDKIMQLRERIRSCMTMGAHIQKVEEMRLTRQFEQVRHALHAFTSDADEEEQIPDNADSTARAEEVFVVTNEDPGELIARLGDGGFQTRYFSDPVNAMMTLSQTLPVALIVEVDFPETPLGGIQMIADLDTSITQQVLVIFITTHQDINVRLRAVRAGGRGYFTRPLDVVSLVEKVNSLLFKEATTIHERVLIMGESRSESRHIAGALEALGIITQICKPLEVVDTLQEFQPDAVILDLDVREVNGLELAMVLRQHDSCYAVPMILLCEEECLSRRLPRLDGVGDELLLKPIADDYLGWLVKQRLSRSRALRTKLRAFSDKDLISGLYNRRHFLAKLKNTLTAMKQDSAPIAVVLLMLDNLHRIRDTTDVILADEVMGRAGQRLQNLLGPKLQIARLSDDVFAVLLDEGDPDKLLTMGRECRNCLEQRPYNLGSRAVRLHACVGIRIAIPGERDFLGLIRQADLACSLAREAGRDCIHIYDSKLDWKKAESFQERHFLEQVTEAAKKHRMSLVFQPIVSLRGDLEKRYEVLLRLHDGQGREMSPEVVFKVAQRYRLGKSLERWVITQSIKLLREEKGKAPSTTLFINLSPAALNDRELPVWLEELLEHARVDPRGLVFEIGEEPARLHLNLLRPFLEQIRAMGCRFTLERFGCRADSLLFLEEIDVDYVKLDSRFVQGLTGGQRATTKQQELNDIVQQLRALGVITIASGIEDPHALSVLWSCGGIDYVQGFFLQSPRAEMSFDFVAAAL